MRHACLLALLIPSLAACRREESGDPGQVAGPAGLLRIHEVGDFHFLERSGKGMGRQDLLGKVWVASFIFTRCAYPCPLMAAEMARLQEEFADRPGLRIVATTVDPGYDTPDVLDAFGKRYGANPERWYFFTGKLEDIDRFAQKGLLVGGNPDNPVNHSTRFTLVDRSGVVRGYYARDDAEQMGKLRDHIRVLLDEKTP